MNTPPSARLAGATITAALLLATTGCSMTNSDLPNDPVARIEAAKAASQSAETRVAGFVPTEDIAEESQTSTGSLLSCSSGKQWSGNTTLKLVNREDADHLVDLIATKAKDDGFDVERDISRAGTPRATLSDSSGVSMLVGVWNDGTVVNIDSFSMCFALPDDFVPDPSY